jgi:hypothetical protein
MKITKRIKIFVAFAVVLPMVCIEPSFARGGFGGGGGRGFGGGFDRGGMGGFDRGDFGRGDMGRGDFGRGDMGRGDAFDRFNDNFDHPGDSAFGGNNTGIRAGENGVRNFGDADRNNLAGDGGFGRIMDNPATSWAGRAGTYGMSPRALADHWNNVNGNFNHWNYFDRNWWGNHHWYWWNRNWGDDWAWGWTGWGDLGGWWGMDAATEPVYYDYGNNITYNGDSVYYGSQPLESTDAYYAQAQALAETAPPTPTAPVSDEQQKKDVDNMKPLGVYALVSGNQNNSSQLLQLAVDKKGVIRGTYYNEVTAESKPVSGAVDKKNQRACFTIAGNKNVVYDTAIGNLLKQSSPILVHYSKSNTQQLTLVRLKKPTTAS